MNAHLRPTAAIAADVILPTDPGLALGLAQQLLDKPLMANHSHGLWGYSGRTSAGRELTIQATGIGGPSAAVVLAELAAHGARRAVRVGSATALRAGLRPGDAVIAAGSLAADGTSAALGVSDPAPDEPLTEAVGRAAGAGTEAVTVASTDLFHDPGAADRRRRWLARGAAVVDLETAALLALGARLGLSVAAVLAIAETLAGERDTEATEARLRDLGAVAALALCEGESSRNQSPAAEARPA